MPRLSITVKTFLALSLLPCMFLLTVLWLVPVSPDLNADRWAKAMRGFSNMWAAGRFMLDGRLYLLFDRELYSHAVKELFGQGFTEQMWGYPPVMGLIVAPLALLPLGLSFAIWTLVGLLIFIYCLKKSGFTNSFILVMLLSPALWESCLSGQTGAFTAGILLIGIVSTSEKSGLALSLMILKPQLAFIFPIKLLAEKAWKTIMVLVTSTALLLTASILWFGCDSWISFFTKTSKIMSGVIGAEWTGAPAQANFSSVFMAAKSIGLTNNIAWLEQGTISLMCIIICWFTWKSVKVENKRLKVAATLILTLLATPYAHDYDLVISAIAVGILFETKRKKLTGESFFMAVAWTWPGMMILWPLIFSQLTFMSPVVSVLSNIGVLFYCLKHLNEKNASHQEIFVAS